MHVEAAKRRRPVAITLALFAAFALTSAPVAASDRAKAFAERAGGVLTNITEQWFWLADAEYHLYLIAMSGAPEQTKDDATREIELEFVQRKIAVGSISFDIAGLQPADCRIERRTVCEAEVDFAKTIHSALSQKRQLVDQLIVNARNEVSHEKAAQLSIRIANAYLLSAEPYLAAIGRAEGPGSLSFPMVQASHALRALVSRFTTVFTLAPVLNCTFARQELSGLESAFSAFTEKGRGAQNRFAEFEAQGPYKHRNGDYGREVEALADGAYGVLASFRETADTVRFWRGRLRDAFGDDCRFNGSADFRAFGQEMAAMADDRRDEFDILLQEAAVLREKVEAARAERAAGR